MIFRQLFDTTSSTYTYLVASEQTRNALFIDPVIEQVDRYLQLLQELDLQLKFAIDTHVHADHVTALGQLREKTQCTTMMGEQSSANCVSRSIRDGDTVELDDVVLTAMYTPGHTDDSYCFLMEDRVFTGDTLMIRGTGRTDFQNGDAGAQYDAIQGRLLTLPDKTLVYPGHDYKGWTVSTIGEERAHNPRLQVEDRAAYITLMENLNLPDPKLMDIAVVANRNCGAT